MNRCEWGLSTWIGENEHEDWGLSMDQWEWGLRIKDQVCISENENEDWGWIV